MEEARARALQNRPEIRQAQLRQVQAEQDLRAKKAESIPEISAEFNNIAFMNWGRYMPSQTMSVGVSLTWEPFDWGRKKHEAAEKQRTIDQARLAQREAEATVLVDENDKHRQLRYRRAELQVARLAQQTSIENLRVAKNKYVVQAVLLKDVLQAQVSLEESNAEYQQALASFWNARADFERALGEDHSSSSLLRFLVLPPAKSTQQRRSKPSYPSVSPPSICINPRAVLGIRRRFCREDK